MCYVSRDYHCDNKKARQSIMGKHMKSWLFYTTESTTSGGEDWSIFWNTCMPTVWVRGPQTFAEVFNPFLGNGFYKCMRETSLKRTEKVHNIIYQKARQTDIFFGISGKKTSFFYHLQQLIPHLFKTPTIYVTSS